MAPGALRTLIAGLVAMLLAAFATPANARASASPCHVGVGLAQDYAALAIAPAQWNCRGDDWPLAAERAFLRFAVAPGTAPPEMFATRLTRFSALRLTVLAADGTGVSRDYAEADLRPATDSWTMRAVLVDVAIDQGGCFETSHATTHQDPTYVIDGVVHYCVANMPGAVARTSTYALNNVTLPHALKMADLGWQEAMRRNPHLAAGLNVHDGKVTYQAVAEELGYAYVPVAEVLR